MGTVCQAELRDHILGREVHSLAPPEPLFTPRKEERAGGGGSSLGPGLARGLPPRGLDEALGLSPHRILGSRPPMPWPMCVASCHLLLLGCF